MTNDPQTGASRERWRSLVEVASCVILAVAPFLWRLAAGTRDSPNDDTWAYGRIFQTYLHTGDIVLIDWNDIMLLGMLPVTRAWVAVVGNGELQLHLLGSLMGLVALLALRSILRSVDARSVAWGLWSFGLFSGYVVTTGTFMADQFALAGGLVAVAAAVRLAEVTVGRATQAILTATTVLAAAFAFTCRQQSVVLAAVAFFVLLMAHRRVPRLWLIAGGCYALLVGPFYLWRAGLENGGGVIVNVNPPTLVVSGIVMVLAVLLALFPLVLRLDGGTLRAGLPLRIVVTLAAALCGAVVDVSSRVSDYLSVFQSLAGASAMWRIAAAMILANIALTVLLSLNRRRPPTARPVPLALTIGVGVSILADVVIVALGADYYARYSLATLALAIPAFLTSVRHPPEEWSMAVAASRRRAAVGAGALVLLGGTSYWALDVAQAPVRAVDEVATVAACMGVPNDRLDAGLVWMGSHTDEIAHADAFGDPLVEDGLPTTQYHRVFPDFERDAVILDAPPSDPSIGVVVGPFSASGLLPGNGVERWLVVRTDVAGASIDQCREP